MEQILTNHNHIMELLGAFLTGVVGPILYLIISKHLQKEKNKKTDVVKDAIKNTMIVEDELEEIREEFNSDRAWISQFHNGGNFYPTGKSIQKFSIFHEIVKPGVKGISEVYKNIPVSLFTKPFMHMYENSEILISNYSKDDTFGLSTFAEGTGAKSSYMFALNSINDEFIGTLGIEYCSRVKSLSDDQLNEARTKAITIGTLLSTYLYETPKK